MGVCFFQFCWVELYTLYLSWATFLKESMPILGLYDLQRRVLDLKFLFSFQSLVIWFFTIIYLLLFLDYFLCSLYLFCGFYSCLLSFVELLLISLSVRVSWLVVIVQNTLGSCLFLFFLGSMGLFFFFVACFLSCFYLGWVFRL